MSCMELEMIHLPTATAALGRPSKTSRKWSEFNKKSLKRVQTQQKSRLASIFLLTPAHKKVQDVNSTEAASLRSLALRCNPIVLKYILKYIKEGQRDT